MRQVRICAMALLAVLAIAGVAGAASTNRIAVTLPAYIVHSNRNAYAVTLSGYSSKRAIAYLFLDYNSCKRSFGAEYQRAQAEFKGKFEYYGVRGSFTEVSHWTSPFALTDHACAYLISRASAVLLAKTHVSFTVH